MIRPVLLAAVVLFSTAIHPAIARAQGRTIQARDGDIVLMPQDASITIARTIPGYVKVVAHREGFLLIVLLDEGLKPDGIVDRYFRFELPRPFDPVYVGEGAGSFEHYEVAGDQGGSRSYGIVLPHGRIYLKSGSPVRPNAVIPEHVAAFEFRNSSFGTIRETFADAEQRVLAVMGIQSEVRLSASAPSAGVGGAPAAQDAPVRVGGNIPQPAKIKDVAPVLPQVARQAGVIGIVIVEITIDPQGRVSNARILRSVPLLDQAALDAVRQWEFAPTYVGGQPRSVIMTVPVPFTGGNEEPL